MERNFDSKVLCIQKHKADQTYVTTSHPIHLIQCRQEHIFGGFWGQPHNLPAASLRHFGIQKTHVLKVSRVIDISIE